MRKPKCRFVEKVGLQIDRDVGRLNPWSGEFICDRQGCLYCQGRTLVGAEKEKAILQNISRDGDGPTIPKEDQVDFLFWNYDQKTIIFITF